MELFKLLGTVAVDTSEANKSIDDTTDKVEKSEGKLTKALGAIGGAVVAAFAVDKIKDFGEAVVGMADNAQDAMNQFSAATGEGMEGYEDVLKSIYKNNYGESFEDIAAAMATVKQQMGDIGTGDLEELTTNALMLRDTFGFDINESMRSAKMLMDQFKISGKDAFNLIAQGAQKGLDKNGDLLDSINEYAVHYEQLGFGAEGFFASLENGTAAGTFSVDKLGDAMKEFGIRTTDGSETSRAAFELLGYDADAMFQIFNEGGAGAATATQEIINKIAAMPEGVDKTTAGVSLFGTMFEDLGVKGIQALGDVNGSIVTTKDSLDQINNVRYDSFGSMLQGMQRTLETSILLPLGEKLLPILEEKLPVVFGKIQEIAPQVLSVVETAFSKVSTAVSVVKEGIEKGWELIKPIVDEAKERFTDFSENIIKPLYETYIANLRANFETLAEIWETVVLPAIEVVKDAFSEIMDSIYENVQPAIETIMEKFNELAELVRQAVEEYILPVVQSFVEMIKELYEENKDKLDLIGELYGAIAENISEKVSGLVQFFKEKVLPFLESVKEFVEENLDKIKATFQKAIDFVTGIIQFFIALFKGDWEGMWQAIKDTLEAAFLFIRGVFELIGAAIADKVIAIKESITTKFEEIKDNITEKIQAAKDKVVEIFDSIKSKIEEKINNAKDVVKTAIDKIKEFFNFDVSLPSIKLPHFSISPPGWKLGDLLEGSIPSLGIEWYAKGGVMEEPTVFGRNGNNLMAGGEAGAEAIAPIDVLQGYIAQAVANQNAGLVAVLQKILEAIIAMDENMGGNLRDAMEGTAFEMNHREFARLVKAVN